MHLWPSRLRISRPVAAAAAVTIVAAVAAVSMQPASAAVPTLNAPGRLYPTVDTIYPFSGTDAISDDLAAITVSGMVEGPNCDLSGPAFAITDCPRIQMALNTTEAGLLRLTNTTLQDSDDVGNTPDTLVHSSGAVITEHTDPNGGDSQLFNFNGTQAMLNDVLGDMSFVPAPGYEERDSNDGDLPNITIQAIQGNNLAESTTRFTYIKVESENLGPTLDAPTAPVPATAGGEVDLSADLAPQDVPSVVDPEMCNETICGLPFTNPGLVEGDDQMLLVAWILEQGCGTFTNFGAFTSLGGATNTSVHGLLTNTPSGLGLRADQAVPVEASISPAALLLDLSGQQSIGNENTVFAGIGDLDEVRHALDTLAYQAPTDDATCHLNYTVSDLGNNGVPLSYEGSSLDAGGDSPEPGYEVPSAEGDTQSIEFVVSDTHPDVAVEQVPPGPVPGVDPTGTAANFSITFSEPVEASSFTASDLDTSASTAIGVSGILTPIVAGSTYTFSATATSDDGKIIVSLPAGAAFAAGHDGDTDFDTEASTSDDNEVTWDAAAPTVTIDKAAGQTDPTGNSPILFTVEFSESITTAAVDFTASDLDLSQSTTANGGADLVAVISQPDPVDFTTFTVTVTGMTTAGNVVATVKSGAVVDQALNPSDASTSTDNTVGWNPAIVDNTPPDVTIDKANGQADPTSTSPIVFTATFTEPVTGFTGTDIDFTGSTTGGGNLSAVVTGGPTAYTVTVTGMTVDGNVVAAIPAGSADDAANNTATASTSTDNTVAWTAPAVDTTTPTVLITLANGQASPTSTSPVHFTATFSEAVTGFDGNDVDFTGTTAGALTATVTGGPIVYDISVIGMNTTGDVKVTLLSNAAFDLANNPSAPSNTGTVAWVQPVVDVDPPDVSIDKAGGQADPTPVGPIVFTATFDEAVTGLADDEISFLGSTAGGTLVADVTGGPSVYSISVTGMTTTGNVVVSIPAGVATDAATNGNTASTAVDATVAFQGPITISTPGGDVTVETTDGVLTGFTTQDPSVPPPAGVTFPFGELSFSATTAPGGLVTFTLTLPDTTDDYFKLVAGAWQSFTFDGETGAQISGTTVTVTVRDNGRGDSDPTLGAVTDPAAPAKFVPTGVTTTTTVDPTSSTTSPASTSTTARTGATTATTARVGSGGLVRTGSDATLYAGVAFLLIGVGTILSGRRRAATR